MPDPSGQNPSLGQYLPGIRPHKAQEQPDDPFSYLYVHQEPGVAIDTGSRQWLPPELMAKIAADSITGDRQACIFTQFLPHWNICGGDPAAPRQLHHCHTYIKSTDPDQPGELHIEHRHQCIRTNVLDPSMDSTCLLNIHTSGATSRPRREQVNSRRAFAPYQRWAIPSVVGRSVAAYGLRPQLQYAAHTICGDVMGKGEPIAAAPPITLDPAALKQLPFRPAKVPTSFQGCEDKRLTRHFHENISILAVNVDAPLANRGAQAEAASLHEALGPEYSEYIVPGVTELLVDQMVETDRLFPFNIRWEKFNRGRRTLRAVFLDLRHLAYRGAAGNTELVRLSTDMLMAGLQLDVICLAGTQHALAVGLRDAQDNDIRELETTRSFQLYHAPDEMLVDEGLLPEPQAALPDEEDDGDDDGEASGDEDYFDEDMEAFDEEESEDGGPDDDEEPDGSDEDMADDDEESDQEEAGEPEPNEPETLDPYVNPIALFRPVLKPGGRLILLDAVSEALWNSTNVSEPQFPPISLVLPD